jgi:class 3 adenylate cyclase/tetratricopeptide (TPR) repeat protein
MRCPSCGNENREDARFCDSCGARLEAPEPSPAGEPARMPADAPELVAGRFAVLGFLGHGGRKDVYLAHDERDGRDVAVALFETEGMGEASLARARREMAAMERLGEHPHVVAVFETGEDNGRPYIVSAHMAGGDVARLLATAEEGRLDPGRAVRIGIDVCRALEHAHSCGVVHRDLKPANVWLDEEGTARLGDFGLAATGPARGAGVLVGTVAYLPPEQALGRRTGPRSDLYSLGALLYQMVAGQPPFLGDDAVAIIGQHLNAEPVAPSRHSPGVPLALDELILELLAKLPEDRPASAAVVRERLEAIRDAPPEPPAPEPEENPLEGLAGGVFVGREAEMGELREAADEALGGRAQLVLLSGEPGIGKTRTSEELATYARVRGGKVHWGRCHEGEGAPSYWPWVQAIRSYVREADPVALAWEMGAGGTEIARVVPELAERLGEVTPADGAEDEQARFRLFDAIANFLSNASGSRPLVLVLDDLHWADEPSLLLLEFVARSLGDASLLLIGTYRDVELGRHHPLSRVLAELARVERTRRVVLRGLSESDIARYVEISAGSEPRPELVAAVHEQTEGNAFFVGELVRLLASEGALADGRVADLAIPQGVRDVVGRRLDQLSPPANEALRVAAAVGRDFEEAVLADVTGIDAAALQAALEEAVAAQLLLERSEGRFRFAHALVRETLYEELTATQRPDLHSRIAVAMEARYGAEEGRVERRLAELAHHYLEAAAAGDPDKAVDYATRAGERAVAQLGYEEAAEHFERALEVLDLCASAEPERRCRLLLSLGEAQTKGGHFDTARPTLERAAEEARKLDSAELLARAALGVAFTTEVGAFDPRIADLLESALDAIGPQDSATRALLTSWLGQEHYWSDPQGRSKELHAEAIAMARRLGDEGTLAHVLSRANFIDISPESARRGVEESTEVLELARRVGDLELEMRTHVVLMRDHLQLGDIRAVDRELAAYAALAEQLRQPQHLWRVKLLRAMRAIVAGRLDEAERLAEEARRGGEAAGEPAAQQFFSIQASVIYRVQGRLGEIVDGVGAMAERYPAVRAWSVARALINADLGRLDVARVDFERLAAERFEGLPLDAQWTVGHAMLCEVVFALDEGPAAELLHERLAPYRGMVVVAGPGAACWGPVARYLGLASAAAGDAPRAVEELEEAIALSRRMGDRPFAAQAELNLAQVLLRRGAAGDRDRALELLDSCLDCAQEVGMPGLSERAVSLKLESQGIAGVGVTTSIDDVIEAVESERPDVRAYAAPDGTVTILFSDIESSTAMTERLGDTRWLELLREHNTVFRDGLRAHGGFEVKNQGDGFMLVFPDPLEALRCAIEVQRTFEERGAEQPEERIRVRMGLHTGEAIAEEGDFFGRNVILAARIAAQAGGGEVFVSEALHDHADGEDGMVFDDGRELELKGLAGRHRVYRAEWQAPASAPA